MLWSASFICELFEAEGSWYIGIPSNQDYSMISLVALRPVSFSLKFGTVVKSSNATKLWGVTPACTWGNWGSGFYSPCANVHLGNRRLVFQENTTHQLISLPLLWPGFLRGLSNNILFKNLFKAPVLECPCHLKAMALFICFYLVIVLGKWSFVFPSHLFPSATVKKLFFKVFRKPKFFPTNSAHRNVLWQKQHWQGHACQHVSWPSVGDPPPLPAWRFPGCNLGTCCVYFGCVKPLYRFSIRVWV